MGYTRRYFVNRALAQIGLATYAYDATAEELNDAMIALNEMMAEWNAKGIRVGYPISSSPETGSLDDETNVPDSALRAISLNLAIAIAPEYGKQVMPATMTNAKRAYNTLLNLHAAPIEMQLKRMPLGGGNKPYRWGDNYTTEPVDRLVTGDDGVLEF